VISSASGSSENQDQLELLDVEEVCRQSARDELDEHSRGQAEGNFTGAKISTYNSSPGKIKVQGDRAKLALAFGEVIKNALTFSGQGQIEIYISHSDGMVVVDIMDDGEGVAPGVEDLIFLNFFQDRSRQGPANARKGLGIGLFIARSVIEEHLGQLGFVRAKGRIGFFRFLIPSYEDSAEKG
jgi:signal transduction histidine kinase